MRTLLLLLLLVAGCRPPKTLAWAASRGSGVDDETGLPLTVVENELGIEMVLVRPGKYLRGDPREFADHVESPAHEVEVPHYFYIGKYEISRAQWLAGGIDDKNTIHPAYKKAVDRVTYHEARAFCRKFGLRLPREVEWEYACRAGAEPEDPNAWGIHDMLGGVSEFVGDIDDGKFTQKLSSYCAFGGYAVVRRGGSAWGRTVAMSHWREDGVGFRVVRDVELTPRGVAQADEGADERGEERAQPAGGVGGDR